MMFPGSSPTPPHHAAPAPRGAGRRGVFTLVELLTVIAIIALLAGILLPVLSSMREKSRATECSGQVRQLGLAVHAYAGDYKDFLPVCARLGPDTTYHLPGLSQLLSPYLEQTTAIFHCPADRGNPSLFADVGTSYEWNTFVSGRRIDRASTSILGMVMVAPLLGDAEVFHGKLGRNYLYPDGHVTPSLEILFTNP